MRPTLTGIEHVLADAGGPDAPRERHGQLRELLQRELQHGAAELGQARSGYEHPIVVAVAADDDGLLAVLPVAPELRADPDAVEERAWLLVAATLGALVQCTGEALLGLTAGRTPAGDLALHLSSPTTDLELLPLAFEEEVAPVDRLKAMVLTVPSDLLEADDLKAPIGPAHPLRVALELARLGALPADPHVLDAHEDAVLAVLEAANASGGPARPHDDPDPSRRVARRILQRLDGMGKWGGYHTDFTHLARGFAGNDRALADAVGEALLASGLLAEKPSVGQRHVFLNPKRAADVRALIETGDVPGDLVLP
jgi:hypothetical protein